MNLQRRVEQLEQQQGNAPQDDHAWRETLNRISKVYGDGSPVALLPRADAGEHFRPESLLYRRASAGDVDGDGAGA